MRSNPEIVLNYYIQTNVLGDDTLNIWLDSTSFNAKNFNFMNTRYAAVSGHDRVSTARPIYVLSESNLGYEK